MNPISKQRLVIVGAGGHASELRTYVTDMIRDGWPGEFLGCLDDGLPKGLHRNLPILGGIAEFQNCAPGFFEDLVFLTALGDNAVRRSVIERLEAVYGDRCAYWTLRHPSAYIGEEVILGAGTCVAPGAMVTTRSKVGRHCILNIKASVSHDCEIGDFVNLNPSATICGWVKIGEGAYIGAGATVIDRMSVGAWSVIGAGAVVVDHIPAGVTAVGVPARIIKQH